MIPNTKPNSAPRSLPPATPAAADGDHHDLDHDAGDLVVDEHRPLDGEQDQADGDDPEERTLDERRQHGATTRSTSDNGL